MLYDYGVRFEEAGDNPNSKLQWWYCMVSEMCRKQSLKATSEGGIRIEKVSTGNATRHLQIVHGKLLWYEKNAVLYISPNKE